MSVVLADLGGTHLRLARAENPGAIKKYKIAEHDALDDILQSFSPDISFLYLASAIKPRNGVIEDKRFGEASRWTIDLLALKKKFNLEKLIVLNDLEAAAYALAASDPSAFHTILPATKEQIHFEDPPKLLVGIGTGIGHAYLYEKRGLLPFVQCTHGGHIPALAVSDEQKEIVDALSSKINHGRDLIVEDIVSGHGLANLQKITSTEDALRLFWEFLGLYCNMIVGLSAAYGGVYLTGGVLNEMHRAGQFMPDSFARYFHRPLVPVVVETLEGVAVSYCRDPDMPITGLSQYAGLKI